MHALAHAARAPRSGAPAPHWLARVRETPGAALRPTLVPGPLRISSSHGRFYEVLDACLIQIYSCR